MKTHSYTAPHNVQIRSWQGLHMLPSRCCLCCTRLDIIDNYLQKFSRRCVYPLGRVWSWCSLLFSALVPQSRFFDHQAVSCCMERLYWMTHQRRQFQIVLLVQSPSQRTQWRNPIAVLRMLVKMSGWIGREHFLQCATARLQTIDYRATTCEN